MPHGAIIGLTTSGKTFLARQLAAGFMKADFASQGNKVMALHKPREPWEDGKECDFCTSDPEEFIAEHKKQAALNCKHGTKTVAFLELSDSAVDKYDVRFHKYFSEGRHDGVRFFYLTQRGATVHPNIRENCVSLYLFMCGGAAAKLWAEEFADKKILEAAELPAHYFVHKANRFSPAVIRKLTIPRKK